MQNNLKNISVLVLTVLFCLNGVFAQQIGSKLISKQIFTHSDTLKLDSLSIIPASVELKHNNKHLSDNKYFIDYVKSNLIIDSSLLNKNLNIKYRVFPINFAQTYKHKDSSLIIKNHNPFSVKPLYTNTKEKPFDNDFNALQKSGSISRGFTFGNNRDMASLSNLNLQLSGKINDELSVLAAISDNNIPIQPDGNTQQIQEFDKILTSNLFA